MTPIQYMHIKLGKGRATAAIRVDVYSTLDGFGEITSDVYTAHVALALCSPKDNFSRKRGRLVAEGRLSKGKKFLTLTVDPDYSVKGQVHNALLDSANNRDPRLPSWAHKPRTPLYMVKHELP